MCFYLYKNLVIYCYKYNNFHVNIMLQGRSPISVTYVRRDSAPPRTWRLTFDCTRARNLMHVTFVLPSSHSLYTWNCTNVSTPMRDLTLARAAARSISAPADSGLCPRLLGPLHVVLGQRDRMGHCTNSYFVLWNVSKLLPDCTVQQPRNLVRTHSSEILKS